MARQGLWVKISASETATSGQNMPRAACGLVQKKTSRWHSELTVDQS